MNSTLLCTPTAVGGPVPLDAVLLPAATAAPAALVIAVEMRLAQEASARTRSVAAHSAVAPYAAADTASDAVSFHTRNVRNATQGPPSRGTPV